MVQSCTDSVVTAVTSLELSSFVIRGKESPIKLFSESGNLS